MFTRNGIVFAGRGQQGISKILGPRRGKPQARGESTGLVLWSASRLTISIRASASDCVSIGLSFCQIRANPTQIGLPLLPTWKTSELPHILLFGLHRLLDDPDLVTHQAVKFVDELVNLPIRRGNQTPEEKQRTSRQDAKAKRRLPGFLFSGLAALHELFLYLVLRGCHRELCHGEECTTSV